MTNPDTRDLLATIAELRAENERLMQERSAALVDAHTARSLISATHKRGMKHENCEHVGCPICDGGLFMCADCGAAEIETEERICPAAEARAERAEAGMATLKQVNDAARAIGATVAHEKYGDSWRLGVGAPHGFIWADGVHEMVDWSYVPWKPDYADMLARMAYGVEPCSDDECEWCYSEHD